MTRTSKNKEYWFYLHPHVHLNIKQDRAVLYNTLNGKLLVYQNNPHALHILKSLDRDANLYVTGLKEKDLAGPAGELVREIREHFCGELMDAAWSSGKPIQFKPIAYLEKSQDKLTFEPKVRLLERDEVGEYLNVVNLYINKECRLDCPQCPRAYKQFPICTTARVTHRANKKHEIMLQDLRRLIDQLEHTDAFRLNILGGNILKHTQFPEVAEHLDRSPFEIHYYLHYLNADPADESWLRLGKGDQNTLHIMAPAPIRRPELGRTVGTLRAQNIKPMIHFPVESEENLDFVDAVVAEFRLEQVELHPFFNGDNGGFFRDNVFIDRDAVQESRLTMRDIFARMSINTLNFKHLTVLSDGGVYANVNHSRLGRLGKDTVVDMLIKELSAGRSWLKIRRRVSPCRSCSFNALCPPISNYEYALGRYDLCDSQLVR